MRRGEGVCGGGVGHGLSLLQEGSVLALRPVLLDVVEGAEGGEGLSHLGVEDPHVLLALVQERGGSCPLRLSRASPLRACRRTLGSGKGKKGRSSTPSSNNCPASQTIDRQGFPKLMLKTLPSYPH